MVKQRMDLLELLRKRGMDGDVDFLREALRVLVDGIMDAEVSAQIGAQHGERSPERVTYRNGYRNRTWDTRVGTMELHIPKLREGSYFPSLLEPRRRSERQLDRVSRELLARAWSAGAGPGDAPFTIDLDSTICETYGLAKEGARDHGYTGKRGYHPLLAVAAGTGDVLMARLREGRANTARGAAHFLRETVGRVRYAGARGQLTVRADSGFYTHAIVAACRRMDVRFSITIRQHARLRSLIEAIPEQDWTPIPYWMEGAAAVAETSYTPFQSKPDAAPVRLIVRRVKPTPGSQLALFATYSYHGFITDREGETLALEADHRRHAEIENAIRDLKYGVGLNHLPSGRFPANGAWLAVQVIAHNLARWTARIGLGEQIVTTKTLRRRFFSMAGRLTRSARRLTLHLPQRWPWEAQFSGALARFRALPLPS